MARKKGSPQKVALTDVMSAFLKQNNVKVTLFADTARYKSLRKSRRHK